MRLLKCQNCNEKFPSDTIIKFNDTYGKKPKTINICSQECIDGYCAIKESKLKDADEYCVLLQYIMDIHEIDFAPNLFHIRLRDLKNGITRIGSKVATKTNGIEWNDLLVAYEYSAKTIKDVRKNKKFDSVYGELSYCLSIVKNNFYHAKQSNNQRKLNDKIDINIPQIDTDEYKYKKQTFTDDISDLF